jgi:NAD+ synthase (glutamine-hydrolysing)
MRIALAQLNPTSGDITGNTAKILAALEAAAAAGADLVVTPEMALPGYCIGDLVEDAGFLAANERALREIANAARGITAVVGFIDFDPAARNESGAILKFNAAAEVQRRRRPARRLRAAARAQNPAAKLSIFRRQAVFRAGDRP